MADWKDIGIADLERQIAELRAELRTAADSRKFWKKAAEEENAKLEAAEAENARLRALPLKDEVERVLEEAISMAERSQDLVEVYQDRHAYFTFATSTRALLSRLRATPEAVSPSDPSVILAGIKRFGLASDGSDLRDLEAAIDRLRAGEQEGWHYGPYGYLIKPIGLNEEHWHLAIEPSAYPDEEVSVPLYADQDQLPASPSVSEGGSQP